MFKSVLVFVMTTMKSFAVVKLRLKRREFFGGSRLFVFSFVINISKSIFITRFVVANENKNKRDFDGERGREREQQLRARSRWSRENNHFFILSREKVASSSQTHR